MSDIKLNTDKYPFVSVIIPVLNSPVRAEKCINALLDQTYPKNRYEIIVVDNGSTDSTPQVIQQYPVTFMIEDNFKMQQNRLIEYFINIKVI